MKELNALMVLKHKAACFDKLIICSMGGLGEGRIKESEIDQKFRGMNAK